VSKGKDVDADMDTASTTTADWEKPFENFESMMAGMKTQRHPSHGFDIAMKTKGNPWDRKM
jgi:hypothetical protein